VPSDPSKGVASVLLTYPTGQDVAFGRNSDGTFVSGQGRFASRRAGPARSDEWYARGQVGVGPGLLVARAPAVVMTPRTTRASSPVAMSDSSAP